MAMANKHLLMGYLELEFEIWWCPNGPVWSCKSAELPDKARSSSGLLG